MPVIPNLRRTVPRAAEGQAPPTPATYVDTPAMDYAAWLSASVGAIAKYEGDASSRRVAVVGSGGGGLAAAYELLRCGFDVTVFEATDRIGGRLFTAPSATGDGNVFEMGAMRFTPSEQVLHHYADVFNASGASTITFDQGAFPDPGVHLTYIAFQGKTYVWDPANPDSSSMPASYETVNDGWTAFMDHGFRSADGSIVLEAPSTITGWLADPAPNQQRIVEAWTAYVDAFVNTTLYDAMVRIFTDPNAPGGTAWNETDFEFFGALGTGFGGFGPLFPLCFLDILRFVVNAVDSDQHELVTGVQSIVDGFLNQEIPRPDGSVTCVGENVVLGTPVIGVTSTGQAVTLTLGDGTVEVFDRAVIATSHRSMELTMGLGAGAAAGALSEPVSDAVRRVHLACSSKVFVESAAFWDEANPASGQNWPRNVVGDTILRNFYTLTYPDAPAGTGALLFSYTWEDDSVKQQTIADPDRRLDLLLRDLETISAPLADAVAESLIEGTAQVIDWQNEPYFFGAFKLNHPGQDAYVASLFYDFLKAGQAADTGVYLAGDSIGFLGGWVENALQTGVNAAAAAAVSLGATLTNPDQGPFACLDPALYDYAVTSPPAAARVPVPRIAYDTAVAD